MLGDAKMNTKKNLEGFAILQIPDEREFTRVLNSINHSKNKEENLEVSFENLAQNVKCNYVNALDLRWVSSLLKKLGATEIREEAECTQKLYPRGGIAIEPLWPVQLNVYYNGNVNLKELKKRMSN